MGARAREGQFVRECRSAFNVILHRQGQVQHLTEVLYIGIMDKNEEKKDFQGRVGAAWSQIAPDAGEPDGCNAEDHIEQIFFHLMSFYPYRSEMYNRVNMFDEELMQWALEYLKQRG